MRTRPWYNRAPTTTTVSKLLIIFFSFSFTSHLFSLFSPKLVRDSSLYYLYTTRYWLREADEDCEVTFIITRTVMSAVKACRTLSKWAAGLLCDGNRLGLVVYIIAVVVYACYIITILSFVAFFSFQIVIGDRLLKALEWNGGEREEKKANSPIAQVFVSVVVGELWCGWFIRSMRGGERERTD